MTAQIAIVSSREIAEQGTLNPRYYVTRLAGESYQTWQRRMEADELDRKAADHERQAAALRAGAARLRAPQ